MSKLFAIIRREFVERVRTRAFLIGTLMGPLLFFGIGAVGKLMFSKPSGVQQIAVIDATAAQTAHRLVDSLAAEKLGAGESAVERYHFTFVGTSPDRVATVRDSLLPNVDRRDEQDNPAADALTGILLVTDSALTAGHLTYLGRNVSSLGDIEHLETALRTAIIRGRARAFGLSDSAASVVTARFDLTSSKVTKGQVTGVGAESAFMFSYILVILLFVAMMPTGVQVMAAVVEEKSNRILEVLVSSVRPFDLMLGKVLGVGAASVLQIGIWGASASILGRFGKGGMGIAQAAAENSGQAVMKMPDIPLGLILVVILYFSLGFLFFSTAYAAVGAMCNTIQETQQVAFPVTIMIMAGYMGSFVAIGRPESTLAKVMTYLPFTAPFIVPTRWSNAPLPLTELLGSVAVCLLGVLGMVWLAARIYRVGILSYGKKPSFKDIWVWIRAS